MLPQLLLFSFDIQKMIIHHRMKEKLKRDHLQTITVPEDKVVWMDKHEIWVNEHMFDIHSKKLENGIYTFTGLYDEEETLLVKKERNVTEKNEEENKILTLVFKCLQDFFYDHSNEIYDISDPRHSYVSLISSRLISPFMEIFTPPPQMFADI
jgi:hypothetical protein